MKKKYLVLIFLLTFYLIFAVKIEQVEKKSAWKCISSDRSSIIIDFTLPNFEFENVEQNNEIFQKIITNTESKILEIGSPDIPQFNVLVSLPFAGDPAISVVSKEIEYFDEINIFPYQGEKNEHKNCSEFTRNSQIYNSKEMFPERITEISNPAIMRDQRVSVITINPFQIHPNEKKLKVIKKIKLEIVINSKKSINEKKQNQKRSRFFENIYKDMIVNYDQLDRDEEYQQPSYLFIYPNDSDVADILEPLLEWKKKKGFEVKAANTTDTGTSLTNIKNYIQNAYDNWQNPPEYVCLIGDAGGSYNIPTGSYGGGEGDQYYSLLEGNDILADVMIGRLSFNSEYEFQTIVNKILKYEKTPYTSSDDWFDKILLVGDPSSSGQSTIITNLSIKETIQEHYPNFAFSEVYSGSFVNQIATNMNSGVSYFNYRGYWGMSNWDISDVNSLNNGFMLPVVVTITCGTGSFEGTYDTMNEAFLKAGTPSLPKGAIACIGTATPSTHTTFNNCVDAGIFYGIFVDDIFQMGGALVRGKLNLYNNFNHNVPSDVSRFSYWNNLMGDPGMEIWTGVPQNLVVSYDEEVAFGSQYLEVTVTNDEGIPVENTWITAYKENFGIIDTGFSDAQGKIFLNLTDATSGTVDLTLTKHDFIPHLGNFTLAESNYLINIESFEIDDDNSGDSTGNDDGLLNPGETIELNMNLENLGLSDLANVQVTMTSSHDIITIVGDFVDFGDISSGQTSNPTEQFVINIDSAANGNTEFRLIANIVADEGYSYNYPIDLFITGKAVFSSDYTILDGGNGIFDPGEEVELTILLSNIGGVNTNSTNAVLQCDSHLISLIDSTAFYGEIPANGEVENNSDHFTIAASSSTLPGSQIPFVLLITDDDDYSIQEEILITVGEVSQTDPLGPDSYGYYCYDSSDTSYDLAPTYNWIEIAPDEGGSGTEISLYDTGDTGDTETINLPFNFIFYGEVYNSIAICTNGWISPGSSEQYSFMNWHIPGPLGPSPMIAVFWDDLTTSGGSVSYYFNESGHFFIVEWEDLNNDYDNAAETFQVILYDSAFYPTATGDSEIKMQYKTFNNVNVGSYGSSYVQHGQYATIGLEDQTCLIGLEYTYNNQYPEAAAPISNNKALFFTTNTGTTLEPPVVSITPENLDFALLINQTNENSITISNSGEAALWYSVTKHYIDPEEISAQKDQGGPDDYGYHWYDSDESGNFVNYDWREISAIGTEIEFVHNDQASEMIPLEFDFNFYGTSYNEFRINPNGWIGFGDDNDEWINVTIPSSNAPKPSIFVYWDDLNPLTGGDVYYYSTPDSLVIEFDDVMHYAGAHNGNYTFEMILYPSGEILFQYKSVSGDIDTATIGIQNEDAFDGLQIVYNNNYIHNEMAILIKHVVEWIDIEPVNGSVLSGNSSDIVVTVNSADLETGDYQCELFITTNDPNMDTIIISVNLQILASMTDIDVSETEIDFGEIFVSSTIYDTLTVTNLGTDPLYVSETTFDNDDFSVNIPEFSLEENETQEIIITFTQTEIGQINAIMTLFSNDPDEGELEITFSANVLSTDNSNDEINGLVTSLQGNYPNPFNPETKIEFSIEQNGQIELLIFNVKGQKVKTLINKELGAARHSIIWNGTDENNSKVSSGIYLYKLKTENYSAIKKMLMIK